MDFYNICQIISLFLQNDPQFIHVFRINYKIIRHIVIEKSIAIK